jgi:hypothetical protein
MRCLPMPAGTDRDRMPASENLAAADDAGLVAWTLWLRAGDLRRYAILARDRVGRGIAAESNATQAAAAEAISARLLRLAGVQAGDVRPAD